MEEKNNKTDKKMSVFSLVFELGYLISLPLVFFALGGAFLDRKINSTPWLLLLGMTISIFISGYLIYKKIKKITDNK
ncbi:MAG: AtpZ/AtpI family protein [Candidatus Moraniibacteriota bacterium]